MPQPTLTMPLLTASIMVLQTPILVLTTTMQNPTMVTPPPGPTLLLSLMEESKLSTTGLMMIPVDMLLMSATQEKQDMMQDPATPQPHLTMLFPSDLHQPLLFPMLLQFPSWLYLSQLLLVTTPKQDLFQPVFQSLNLSPVDMAVKKIRAWFITFLFLFI